MLQLRLFGEDEGVSGFFEDIPALIVVILGFGIFLASIANAFVTYQAQQDSFRMHEKSLEFTRAIRGYDKLTYNYMEGIFEGKKLLGISNETIEEDFNPDRLGYDYRIIVNDVSDYPNSNLYVKSFQTSSLHLKSSKYTIASSVVIKVEEHYHSAQLIVTIW